MRAQALAVLDSGESLLLRISPTAEDPVPGKLTAHNPCLSGGTLEIFLEPVRPAPLVAVFGDSPIARALVALGVPLGYDVRGADENPDGATAVVVASHGRDEQTLLSAALRAGVGYVALVASPARGAAVVAALDVEVADRTRVVTPAGLDLGARTAPEVALSILADIVARRPSPPRSTASAAPPADEAVSTAVDPVCGMTVAAVETSLHLDHDGRRSYFCGTGCLRAFAAEPARYAIVPSS